MKRSLHQETLQILSVLKSDYGLSQKKIAAACGISAVDISKAKNTDEANWNEISTERWRVINEKLTLLLKEYTKEESTSSPPVLEVLTTESDVVRVACTVGLLAGVASCFVALFFRNYLGFQHMASKAFHQMLPLLFVVHTALGAFIGQLSARTVVRQQQQGKGNFLLTATLVFLLTTILRGGTARDSYLIGTIIDGPIAGPLGEPNFELLATSLSLAFGSYLLMRALSQVKAHSWAGTVQQAVWLAIYAAALYFGIYVIYLILLETGWVSNGDYWLSPAWFEVGFSHPERLPWIWLFIFLLNVSVLSQAGPLLQRHRIIAFASDMKI